MPKKFKTKSPSYSKDKISVILKAVSIAFLLVGVTWAVGISSCINSCNRDAKSRLSAICVAIYCVGTIAASITGMFCFKIIGSISRCCNFMHLRFRDKDQPKRSRIASDVRFVIFSVHFVKQVFDKMGLKPFTNPKHDFIFSLCIALSELLLYCSTVAMDPTGIKTPLNGFTHDTTTAAVDLLGSRNICTVSDKRLPNQILKCTALAIQVYPDRNAVR